MTPAETASSHPLPCMLVVDDEEGPRLSLQAVFHDQFQVLSACNSTEAMAVLANHDITVAILDIKMVGESGLDLLARIKQTAPMIECIMLSAFQTLGYAQQALKHGAVAVMSKPFDLHELTEAVGRALRLHRVSEAVQGANSVAEILAVQNSILHNVRNHMTVLTGYVDLIRHSMEGKQQIPQAEMHYLSESLALVAKHADLVNETLTRFRRLHRESLTSENLAELTGLLGELADMIAMFQEGRNCTIKVETHHGEIRVGLTGAELSQLVLNLGRNAVEAAPGKNQTLWLRSELIKGKPEPARFAEGPGIRVVRSPRFDPLKPMAVVSLQDEAGGIPLAILPKLFTPYYSTKPRGSGIGLNYIATLVNQNAGCLRVVSHPGVGTRMEVFLPLEPTPAQT